MSSLKRCGIRAPDESCAHFAAHGYHAECTQKGPSRLKATGGFAPGNPTETLWRVLEALMHAMCETAEARLGSRGGSDPAADAWLHPAR